MSDIINNSQQVDLSGHTNVFCDSLQALQWAREHGLPDEAKIRTSSPALLWGQDPNIINVEACWTVDKLGKFQQEIQKHTEDVFDAVRKLPEMEDERALSIAQTALMFQRTLYKAACLEENDFTEPRLVILVEGEGGPGGNKMNSPWCKLLKTNPQLSVVSYTLKNNHWEQLSTNGVTKWKRFQVAGIETLLFRVAMKVMSIIPDGLFTKEALIPNENELVIETAASLAQRGVKLTELKPVRLIEQRDYVQDCPVIFDRIFTVIQTRVKEWVAPSVCDVVMECFQDKLQQHLNSFERMTEQWLQSIRQHSISKKVVLMNAPGNIKGQTLALVCRKNGIPLVAAQHGVTIEISKLFGEVSCGFDNSVADCVLAYNKNFVTVGDNSHFARSKVVVVGASSRHIRMKRANHIDRAASPIVYISTNLYRGNLGFLTTSKTDYYRAREEQKLILDVFAKLPHKLLYKIYPDDNRRYADADPVLKDVELAHNIELFSGKIDVRYLLSRHRIFVTSSATSTLGWPVMTGKPVVFINRKHKSPLTEAAHNSMSQGLFLFDDDEAGFHNRLCKFLSQPIEEIEQLWELKKEARKNMIMEFFSAYASAPGGRAAKIIMQEYL